MIIRLPEKVYQKRIQKKVKARVYFSEEMLRKRKVKHCLSLI